MIIRAVIFDMDGLMLDTEPLYRVAWKQACAECGYELSDELYKRLVGRNPKDSEQTLLHEFGAGFSLEKFQSLARTYLTTAFTSSPIRRKPGLDSLLTFLESRRMPKAVATSNQRHRALPLLQSTQLLERFDAVATGDEVARGKPSPDLFLLAAQRLGMDPCSCLVLEDAESGVIAAHQAGMQVFNVPDLVEPSLEVRRRAHGIFSSLADVARNLELASISTNSEGIDLQTLKTD
jgi:HAD superfamily hydrolase (TIGR01509 family)